MTVSRLAPRFEVKLSGLTLAADLADQIISLVVETDLDLAGTFRLVLRNLDNTLLDSALLDLGKTVEIHLGYGADLLPAFLGEIAAIEPSFPNDGARTITVTGYDKSYRMRHVEPGPTEYNFLNDSLIAAQIAVLNGLVPVVDPAPGLPEKVIQTQTDMAFLKSRAARHYFDVYVEWDRLHFQFPRPQTSAYVLEWGRNLSSFSPRISAAAMAGLQVIRGYNQELAQTIYVAILAAELNVDNLIERLGSSAVELLGSLVRKGIRRQPVDNPLDAAELARSLLSDLLEGMYEGSGSCIGLPELSAGRYLEIRGVGSRFSGTYRARKVTHRIDGSGFSTSFAISQRGSTSLLGMLRKQVVDKPSPDGSAPFYGVVVGKVEENNEVRALPPAAPLGRVKVSFPGLSDSFTSSWAPCARPMAGGSTGFWALPEVGEQVLVAFEQGDVNKPYVLGSLWAIGQGPPADNVDGLNNLRVIKTRSGHTITFDDTSVASKLVVQSGGGHRITLDDTSTSSGLVVQDAAGSSITLDSRDGSITLNAQGDLTIRAQGTLTLTAAAGATTISMTAAAVDIS